MPSYPVANPSIHQRAREVLALQPLFLDTETTGTGPGDLIIEVGIVDAQGNELFNSLVNPGIPIPAESSAVNGITNADVADEPKWPQVWPKVEEIQRGGRSGSTMPISISACCARQCCPWAALTLMPTRPLHDEDVRRLVRRMEPR